MKITGAMPVFVCGVVTALGVHVALAQEPAAQPGCEAKQKSGGENEQTRFFAAPLPAVKEALASALSASDFKTDKDKADLIEAHRPHKVGVVTGSGGEKILLHLKEIEQDGRKGVQVSAETVKTMVGRLGQKSWTGAVLDQTACNLAKTAGAL